MTAYPFPKGLEGAVRVREAAIAGQAVCVKQRWRPDLVQVGHTHQVFIAHRQALRRAEGPTDRASEIDADLVTLAALVIRTRRFG